MRERSDRLIPKGWLMFSPGFQPGSLYRCSSRGRMTLGSHGPATLASISTGRGELAQGDEEPYERRWEDDRFSTPKGTECKPRVERPWVDIGFAFNPEGVAVCRACETIRPGILLALFQFMSIDNCRSSPLNSSSFLILDNINTLPHFRR